VAGTSVSVQRIAGWYKLGLSPEEIAENFGHLSLAQVHAALADYHSNREFRQDGRSHAGLILAASSATPLANRWGGSCGKSYGVALRATIFRATIQSNSRSVQESTGRPREDMPNPALTWS
jgi:hypothetical protein